jgi:protein ImuB
MQNVAADRKACVDLSDFPLQLLLRKHPQWRKVPVAVVSRETSQGQILIPSTEAQKKGVVAGISYMTALGLAPKLRVSTVSQDDMNNGRAMVMERLHGFAPKVQPDKGGSGSFWLSASGLERLYASLHSWGNKIRTDLRQIGFKAVVVVGFSRFGTFALARKESNKTIVLESPEQETALARSVLLEDLMLPPWITHELSKLGKNTVGDLVQLPAEGILERYGPLIYRIWRLASGDLLQPLVSENFNDPLTVTRILDHPESNTLRLTFLIKRLLRKLLSKIAERHQTLTALDIILKLDSNTNEVEHLRPAHPTLKEKRLIDLVRLRLENRIFKTGVIEIQLDAQTVSATTEQLQLFAKRPRRNLKAANRAFARLRAQFGPDAVVQIRMRPGHLPEAQFSFEPLERATLPRAVGPRRPTLVRRVFTRPFALKTSLDKRETSAFSNLYGPYILSGGWWNQDIHREYFFVKTKKENLLWVYFDRKRGRWFIHGTVE